MKAVCDVLGVARSNIVNRMTRLEDWEDGRHARTLHDHELIEEIERAVVHLPSYGYRRVWGVLRRAREQAGAAPLNAKRVYRVMREQGLLLQRRRTPSRPERRHDGQVAVKRSDQRGARMGSSFVAITVSRCA